ncbi:MAG: glutathione S-transferase family protein [Elstera sp.]
MSDELIFFTNPQSRGRVVRWMLEEIGVPYEARIVQYGPDMKAPEYLAINPLGKVPAIRHNGAVVTETGAICAYLADAFPQAGLIPPLGTAERAAYFRWMYFGAGPLDGASTNKALGVEVPPEKRGTVGYGSFELVVSTLENRLKEAPYFAGDAFSAADIYTGSMLGWLTQFKVIPLSPTFETYLGRLYQRPAALRAAAMDNALVSPKQT